MPTPAVAYAISPYGQYDSALMVLEDVRREPLGAITPESLEAEGFASYDEFVDHWIAREHRRFPTLRMTAVYRIRPWEPRDEQDMADVLLDRLYGEFLDEARASREYGLVTQSGGSGGRSWVAVRG